MPILPSANAPHVCPECSKPFGKKTKLERHLLRDHAATFSIAPGVLSPPPSSTNSPAPNTSTLRLPAVLHAALAEANAAFDAGTPFCPRCPPTTAPQQQQQDPQQQQQQQQSRRRPFDTRKDLAAHLVAKHADEDMRSDPSAPTAPPLKPADAVATTRPSPTKKTKKTTTSAKTALAPTSTPTPAKAATKKSPVKQTDSTNNKSDKMVATETNLNTTSQTNVGTNDGGEASARSSFKRPLEQQSVTSRPTLETPTSTNNSNAAAVAAATSPANTNVYGSEDVITPATPLIDDDMEPPLKRAKSSGTKPPVTPRKPRGTAVSPKTQALAAANASAKPATTTPSITPTKPLPSVAAATATASPLAGVRASSSGDRPPSVLGGEHPQKPVMRAAAAAAAAVLDFSSMGGFFANTDKSYYRLVDS